MRDNRGRWTCISDEKGKNEKFVPLSTKDMNYWKGALRKILKVGLEFEFNLPEQKGTCKGDSNACPCVKMNSEKCWQVCANADKCAYLRKPELCKNFKSSCKPESCLECSKYVPNAKAKCPGIYCVGFIPACFACGNFDTDCKKCANRYDPKKNPEEIRARMKKELNPSNSYGEIRDLGVHSIATDGSLLGQKGAEIITVGRRVDYWEFHQMAKSIIENAVSKGAWINERCSIHMHLLGSYYSKIFPNSESNGSIPNQINELEKPMPEIILANFHQLCRRYQNAITWMTTGLDNPSCLTRWEKFRVSNLEISAILNSMAKVRELVSASAGGNKYGWCNYNYTVFDDKNRIKRLHLEMRVADILLAPSVVAAVACMFHAMMIKAVEISRYGVIEVGDSEWMEQARVIKNALMNGTGDYGGERFSDTRKLEKHYGVLIEESLDLVNQLKHILMRMGPAYQVLEKIAEKPCSLRRIHGDDWDKIERDVCVEIAEDDKLYVLIDECIDLRYTHHCKSLEEWISQTAKILGENPEINPENDVKQQIENYITRKKNDGEMIWSDTLGSVIKL